MLLWIPILLGIYWFFKSKQKTKEKFEALPKEGPMKVNITTRGTDPSIFAKHIRCAMDIDVTISQKDWASIMRSGMNKHTLFDYPGLSGDPNDPENIRQFTVDDLKNKTHIGFTTEAQMEQAKEQLIQGLANLRQAIDYRSQGPQTESLEI